MRKRPDLESPETLTHRPLDLVVQTRTYELITPLYGGGVTPGEFDPLTPVRGSEIRGLLRFWWRATRGGNPAFEGDSKKMRRAEGALWGAATVAGQSEAPNQHAAIQITIEVLSPGRERKPFLFQKKVNNRGKVTLETVFDEHTGLHPYVVFPLNLERTVLNRGNTFLRQRFGPEWSALGDRTALPGHLEEALKKAGIHLHTVRQGVSFRLTLTFSAEEKEIVVEDSDEETGQAARTVRLNVRQEVEAALWAWETFGGIGARTRRGFGALRLLKVGENETETENKNLPTSNQLAEVKNWFGRNLRAYVAAGPWPKDVPHLEQALSYVPTKAEAEIAVSWYRLIEHYAAFRQSRPKANHRGRSNWPEAEAIRDIVGYGYYDKLGHPERFPRAAFGLPIIFHFKDAERGDPPDMTLQGEKQGNERLASPLILRPLACADGSSTGLAAMLKGSRLPPLVLKEGEQLVKTGLNAQLDQNDLALLSELDDDCLDGETDVLQAFLNDLRR